MIGLYLAGDSPLHRLRPGLKLAGLLVFTTVLVALRSVPAVSVGALVVALGYAVAGLGPAVLARQLWPLRWILLVLIPFQLWSIGWQATVVVVGTLVVAVAAAALLTLTTRVVALLDSITALLGPLRHVGIDPDRIGLAFALVVRSLPALLRLAGQSADARRARGAERSPRALLVPFVVRAVRYAQHTGDALAARGVDD